MILKLLLSQILQLNQLNQLNKSQEVINKFNSYKSKEEVIKFNSYEDLANFNVGESCYFKFNIVVNKNAKAVLDLSSNLS